MGGFAHETGSRAPQQPKICANTRGFAHFLVQTGEICVKWPDSHIFWPKTGKYVRNGALYTFTEEIPGQARNEGPRSALRQAQGPTTRQAQGPTTRPAQGPTTRPTHRSALRQDQGLPLPHQRFISGTNLGVSVTEPRFKARSGSKSAYFVAELSSRPISSSQTAFPVDETASMPISSS